MNDVKLPRYVLNRFERRLAARFAQTPRQSPSLGSRDDPFRSPQVQRLLEGLLKPPTRDSTSELPRRN